MMNNIERGKKQTSYILIIIILTVLIVVGVLQNKFEAKIDTQIQNISVSKITNLCINQNFDEKSSTDLIKSVVAQFEQFQITRSVNRASTCLYPSFGLLKFETENDLVGFEITHATNHDLDSQTVTIREKRRSYYEGNFGAAQKTESTIEQFILKKSNKRWLIVSYSRAN